MLVRDAATLGEGWHHRRGDAHAEVEALRDAGARGLDVRGSTAYVSLEPCDHHGLTPPCSEALIAAGIARAVIGSLDPDPRTAGGGVRRLLAAGIAVDVVDDPGSRAIVEAFRWRAAHPERPFLTLKMAQSLDGFIAPHQGAQYWLTGGPARERVREMRIEHDAVMVGAGTVRIDDPLLTVRPHHVRRKPYTRVVACERAPIPRASRILQPPADAPAEAYARTIVLAPAGARDRFAGLEDVADVLYAGDPASTELDLPAALLALRARGITSVLCEGGPTLAARLLSLGAVQRAVWFVAPVLLRGPDAVPVLAGAVPLDGWRFDESERAGEDLMLTLELHACSAG